MPSTRALAPGSSRKGRKPVGKRSDSKDERRPMLKCVEWIVNPVSNYSAKAVASKKSIPPGSAAYVFFQGERINWGRLFQLAPCINALPFTLFESERVSRLPIMTSSQRIPPLTCPAQGAPHPFKSNPLNIRPPWKTPSKFECSLGVKLQFQNYVKRILTLLIRQPGGLIV